MGKKKIILLPKMTQILKELGENIRLARLRRKTVFVYADWNGITEPILMGKLYSQITRGEEIFSFE